MALTYSPRRRQGLTVRPRGSRAQLHRLRLLHLLRRPRSVVFVESWRSKEAHEWHLEQNHTKAFIAFHEPKHVSFSFETINAEP